MKNCLDADPFFFSLNNLSSAGNPKRNVDMIRNTTKIYYNEEWRYEHRQHVRLAYKHQSILKEWWDRLLKGPATYSSHSGAWAFTGYDPIRAVMWINKHLSVQHTRATLRLIASDHWTPLKRWTNNAGEKKSDFSHHWKSGFWRIIWSLWIVNEYPRQEFQL